MSADRPRSIPRQLFSLAAPIIGLNLLSVVTLAIDTAMCGRLENSAEALKALGFAVQLVFLMLVAMMGLTVGTVALVSRAHGAGQADRVNHILVQSTRLTVIIGLVVGAIGAVFATPALQLMGASDPVADLGAEYLRPLMLGAVFYYLMILYGAVFRGVGNTRIPFMCALFANVLNIGLNYCLILGNLGFPALGVGGAAIGTVIAQATNTGLLILALRSNIIPGLTLRFRDPDRNASWLDRPLATELYRIGAPAALDMVILNAGFLTIVGMLGRIDEIAVAAHGVGLRVQALAFVPGLAVSQATGAMVGQALGAGDADRAREVARAAVVLSAGIMTALAAAIFLAAYPLVGLFDVEPGSALEAYSVQWMQILGYCMFPVGVYIALVGVLQGAGATNTSLRINMVTTLVIQIPLAALLGFTFEFGAAGVWASFALAFVAKCGLGIVAYRRGRWAVLGARVSHAP